MQSRTMSLVEAITNAVVGYVVAVLTQLAVFPLFGLEAAFDEHLAVGLVFIGVSLVRSYLLRRLFDAVRARLAGSAFDTGNGKQSSAAGLRAHHFQALRDRVREHTL